MYEVSDSGAAFPPDAENEAGSYRPRGTYAGYRAFGSGDGAVLLAPRVARELRSAAESATRERRAAGGLLYGRHWADEQGAYLVIDGYLDARPAPGDGDRARGRGAGDFALPAAARRLLREEAARMYPSDQEAGWWRSLPALGEFGPRDLATHAELAGPDGVGLLVYGSGPHWGTAYLGPDGHPPDTAGTLVAAVEPAAATAPPGPGPEAGPEAGLEAGLAPEPGGAGIETGDALAEEPLLLDTGLAPAAPYTVPPWRQASASTAAPVRAAREWAALRTGVTELPREARFAAGALIAVTIAAAVIAGVLTSSALVAVVIAAGGLLVAFGSVLISRR